MCKGDLDRAIADLDETIRLDAEYVMAYLHRGMAWKKKGDKERAEADFKVFNRRPGARQPADNQHTEVVTLPDRSPHRSD
jgi:hypothetical protein